MLCCAVHCTALHCTELHCTTLHCIVGGVQVLQYTVCSCYSELCASVKVYSVQRLQYTVGSGYIGQWLHWAVVTLRSVQELQSIHCTVLN